MDATTKTSDIFSLIGESIMVLGKPEVVTAVDRSFLGWSATAGGYSVRIADPLSIPIV